jgi:hypothetical protein
VGQRKITILEPAVHAVAQVSFFIEGQGLPKTAKKFVDEAFAFFDTLSESTVTYRPCRFAPWQALNYRCVAFKKYTIAYLELSDEVIICEFVASKLLK